MHVRNRQQLTNHGNEYLRNVASDIIEHALEASDPYSAAERLLKIEGDRLRIGELSLGLNNYERIFIIGAGKASRRIAQALEEKLGDRISDGLFVLKHGDEVDLKHAQVIYAAHPIPDDNSLKGGQLMMSLVETFTEKDLVFAGITGGSSALLELPVRGVTLGDIQKVYQLLLLSGADIVQINSVRKHLSRIKGGWLAKQILPATLINLTVSDVVGDMLDYITGPTVPDTSSFEDARCVMDEYGLWDSIPASAKDYIIHGGSSEETPKDFGDLPLYSFVIIPGDAACVAAKAKAQELGFKSMILTSMLRGEAKEAGSFLASVAQEITSFGRPITAPCAIIVGGENVVTIGSEQYGDGGPNQEFALSAGIEIANLDNIVIAAIDTDGFDGSTDSAGAMVDGSTKISAEAQGYDPSQILRNHDVDGVLRQIGDAVITGSTGTNVNDLKLLLIE